MRFGSGRNEVIVEGKIVDSETVTCQTPNYEMFGAMGIEVRVCINGGGWTVNKIQYTYFANTAARHSIAFGPGLLSEAVYGIEVPFMIQVKFFICLTLLRPMGRGGTCIY